MIFSVGTS